MNELVATIMGLIFVVYSKKANGYTIRNDDLKLKKLNNFIVTYLLENVL